MKLSIVSYELPEPSGTAPERALAALCEGLLAEGHDLEVVSWTHRPPTSEPPPWCRWLRPAPESSPARRARALVRPRGDSARLGWSPPSDAIAVADDPPSFAAVEGAARSVVTMHYLTRLDVRALRRRSPRDVQDRRAEARAAKRAALVLAYSERVAAAIGPRAVMVPIAYPAAPQLPPIDEPVAALVANWEWDPNRVALARLLAAWPEVRARVPAARLLIAGFNSDRLGVASGDGIEVLGPVADTAEVLGRAAVVAFPCPASSGPKMKVLEAMAFGIPVVTTSGGVEGIVAPPGHGTVVAALDRFGHALAGVLAAPERRAEVGRLGRTAMLHAHGPVPAARARVDALAAAFGEPS